MQVFSELEKVQCCRWSLVYKSNAWRLSVVIKITQFSHRRTYLWIRHIFHRFFEPEVRIDWKKIKHVGNYHEMNEEEGVIRDMYDGVITDFDTTSEDESDY